MTRVRSTLRRRFEAHLHREQLVPAHSTVMVALSGGLDSTVMLHLLRFGDLRVRVVAAHLDHAMRAGSALDAAWVRGLCTAWRVPITTRRVTDTPRGERAARDVRYAFLREAADGAGASRIVTAHHADDQAETVLFRLARGTGPAGLTGIPQRRGAFVRPLLPFTRDELLEYAAQHRVGWREDATNESLVFARNRIRHVVVPALEAVHPGAARNIAALAARASQAEASWQQVVRRALARVVLSRTEVGFVLARDRLLAYDPHVRARVLRSLLSRLGAGPDGAVTRVAVEFVEGGRSGTAVALGSGVELGREFDRLRIGRPSEVTAADTVLTIDSPGPGTGAFTAGGRRHDVRWGANELRSRLLYSASFDPFSLTFPLMLRAWRPGDRIRMGCGTRKLKKLFQEMRIDHTARSTVPVLLDADGRVLWVAGVARAAAGDATDAVDSFTITVGDGGTV